MCCPYCGRCTATGCWCSPVWTSRRSWRTSRCCRSREIGVHLSDMADAALAAALKVATRSVCGDDGEPPRLAVIAMGKCGARELNYVSDVDVIFVAEEANAVTTRVAGELMRFASEAFFEVDAALRPEGKHGQLVRTLDSHVAYYQRWAKTWEFQALMKARPAAGDAELGEQYIAALMPMVWTACEREDFVPEVQAMRRRVEALVPADERARELKLGTGGLRDVEFAVQLLQLVHGRNDESLHVASTVDALAALGDGGYIGRDDSANMTASYEFLRLLEHRLQLQRLKRTHMLPDEDDDEAMRWLARAAHMRPDGKHDAFGGVARGAQAAEPAGVAAARQAVLSAAAGVGWATGARLDVRGCRTSARRAGIRESAERADPPCGADRAQRQARPGAAGAAADAAGLAVGHARSGCGAAGVSPDQRRAGRPSLVPVHAARRRRGGQAADAGAGDVGVRAGTVDAGAGGHPAVRRRAQRAQAARGRAGRGGAGVGRVGRAASPIRCAPSRPPAHCVVGSWPASRRRTFWGCSR